MRILVVEDSEVLRESLVDGLSQVGHAVDGVGDGKQALIHAKTTEYDLIVLDLMIPEIDGIQVLTKLRSAGQDTHVLILSAKDRVSQRVEGLRAGADDYLVKPFAFDELIARVEALGRRAHGRKSNALHFPGFRIDLSRRSVLVEDNVVGLTPLEFSLMECLALNAGKPVRRMQIEEHVYDEDSQVWSNAIDSLVAGIRKKMTTSGCVESIQTRRGIGYQLPETLDESRGG